MFCSGPGQTYFISLFSGEIRSSLELSHGQLGTIYSMATLCSAFVLLRTGSLIDRFPPHKIVIIVVTMLAIGGLLLAYSQNLFMLFIACFLLRQFGQGLTSMAASTTMMRYLPKNKGKANALSNIGYSASEAIMPSVILFLIATVSWRTSWIFIGLGLVLIVPCLSLLLRSSSSYRSTDLNYSESGLDSVPEISAVRQWTRADVNETPRCKQRGIYFASKIYSVASHGEFNPRTRLKIHSFICLSPA